MTEAIFTLNSGRKLSYALYGPEDAKPILYFHGTPSSRREPLLLRAGMTIVRRKECVKLPAQKRSGLRWEDYRLLQKGLQQVANVALKEATRKGARLAVHEAASYFKEPGYAIKNIQQPLLY